MTGILFHDRQEAGFSANRIWLAAGFVVGFLTADVITETQQLWIMLVLIVLTGISYTVLAALTQKREDLFPCCIRVTSSGDAVADDIIPETDDRVPVTEMQGNMAELLSWRRVSEATSDQPAGVISETAKVERALSPVNMLFNRKTSLDLSVWQSM